MSEYDNVLKLGKSLNEKITLNEKKISKDSIQKKSDGVRKISILNVISLLFSIVVIYYAFSQLPNYTNQDRSSLIYYPLFFFVIIFGNVILLLSNIFYVKNEKKKVAKIKYLKIKEIENLKKFLVGEKKFDENMRLDLKSVILDKKDIKSLTSIFNESEILLMLENQYIENNKIKITLNEVLPQLKKKYMEILKDEKPLPSFEENDDNRVNQLSKLYNYIKKEFVDYIEWNIKTLNETSNRVGIFFYKNNKFTYSERFIISFAYISFSLLTLYLLNAEIYNSEKMDFFTFLVFLVSCFLHIGCLFIFFVDLCVFFEVLKSNIKIKNMKNRSYYELKNKDNLNIEIFNYINISDETRVLASKFIQISTFEVSTLSYLKLLKHLKREIDTERKKEFINDIKKAD